MNKIIYIGMDVHSSNFTLCSFESGYGLTEDKIFGKVQFKEDFIKNTEKYICNLKKQRKDIDVVCGYEAGCLGYVPQKELSKKGIKCIILAPTTMAVQKGGKKIKNDFRDAIDIAKCLASGAYKPVYIPDTEDEDVRDYIRMRDDHNTALKHIKQQLNAFLLRHGFKFDGKSKWTLKHLEWIKKLSCTDKQREIINEYFATYETLKNKIDALDVRIEELSQTERYADTVKKLTCIKGIKTHTALSFMTEVGDFNRFESAEKFAGYIGLAPGEQSSGDSERKTSITKAGNRHLRRLAIEGAWTFMRGFVGQKSAELKKRQKNMPQEVVAYADKASIRCKRKYNRLTNKGKDSNKAITAVARELCCFIWGMATSHYDGRVTQPTNNSELRESDLD
ncbi:IS110 family transposase [Succinivibrio dextrinosolvens]|uniref:IS110 family transposase n=1 Tax=Succinivibrio dextrinosolvens TaxID=83771 RepID=UPI001EEDF9FF|nr:IS110 family transposase [Succinivibrio dextrinosolvens]